MKEDHVERLTFRKRIHGGDDLGGIGHVETAGCLQHVPDVRIELGPQLIAGRSRLAVGSASHDNARESIRDQLANRVATQSPVGTGHEYGAPVAGGCGAGSAAEPSPKHEQYGGDHQLDDDGNDDRSLGRDEHKAHCARDAADDEHSHQEREHALGLVERDEAVDQSEANCKPDPAQKTKRVVERRLRPRRQPAEHELRPRSQSNGGEQQSGDPKRDVHASRLAESIRSKNMHMCVSKSRFWR